MPIWGIFALGAGAVLTGWLFGSRRVTQSLVQVELIRLAKDWDKLSQMQQDRIAEKVVESLRRSGSARAMNLGADFLEDMDRTAEAAQLRADAAAVTVSG